MKRYLVVSALFVAALTVIGGPQPALAEDANTPSAPSQVQPGQPAQTQPMFGAIAGVVRSSAKLPVVGAMVTASRTDGKGIWTTISGTDGIYSIPNIAPGEYQVTTQAEGYPDITVSALQVAAGRATRTDVAMASSVPAQPVVISANTPVAKVPAATTPQAVQVSSAPPVNVARNGLSRLIRDVMGTKSQAASEPVNTASLIPPVSAFDRRADDTADNPFPTLPSPQGPTAPAAQQEPSPPPAPATDVITPFADWDWTWLNGNTRQHDSPLDSKYFSGEFRADTFFGIDGNQPIDHSMGGSSEVFRSGEVQVEDLSIGGDFHDGNMRGRVLMLYGMFASTTVRNDPSPAVGQWDVRSAYKYVSEAYGGYHFNVQHGLNVDAGIFVSYVGLFSYHNFDNWAYQPSYVSSNTPWFFNGIRIQWFPTNHLKIEPWIINGWQSYNKMNGHLGLGGQLKWTPYSWMNVIGNQYGYGEDNVGIPGRQRYHTDDSIEIKYYEKAAPAGNGINRMAFTFTGDAGCENGAGVTCAGGKGGPRQDFLGWMAYNRWWFHKDLFAFTAGGGQMDNPGRYLTLVLPVNGADAISGTPYFPAYPGAQLHAYDMTATFDWMPSQFFTFRTEFGYRHTSVPYWSGRGGITPPGGNNGAPQNYVCSNGANSGFGFGSLGAAQTACAAAGDGGIWYPDLREGQALLSFAIMVKL
jgi:hypothetical protein